MDILMSRKKHKALPCRNWKEHSWIDVSIAKLRYYWLFILAFCQMYIQCH